MSTTSSPPPYTTRVHEGHEWVDFDGLMAITGYGRSRLRDLAETDQAFPAAAWLDGTGRKAGHRQWYQLTDAQDYGQALADRRRRPLPDYAGDPDAPLSWAEAADVWGIKATAFRRYIYRSIPSWMDGRSGLVPFPDSGCDPDDIEATTPRHWRWTARQLQEFPRPGLGKKVT